MKPQPASTEVAPSRTLVLAPVIGRRQAGEADRLEEARGLAQALDLDVRLAETVVLRAPTPATLFGSGKLVEIGDLCRQEDIEVIVVDGALTPIQQRNLERALHAKVIDRTGLILEIFGRRARTREGRLQVELARLEYERSRLVRTWTHLERQRGGFGFLGGPGETQLESDRRLLLERITRLRKDLDEVRRTRGLQRRARKRAPAPTIALVGYTNAGKSTLFNRLTGAEVMAKDMLFATLDPTMRRLTLPAGREAVLSDTVGFISDLPHELVESFRATLEEVAEADVIVHVRDVSSPAFEAQGADVDKVLADLGLDPEERSVLEVWNKIDRLEPEARSAVIDEARARRAVPVSAVSGEGEKELLAALTERIDPGEAVALELGHDDGEALAWIYRHGRVLERTDSETGVKILARLDPRALGRFAQLRTTARATSA